MMTEREAWTAIADTLEMTGEMTPYGNTIVPGLCGVIYLMWSDELISEKTFSRMNGRIERALGKRQFLAPRYQVAHRIHLASGGNDYPTSECASAQGVPGAPQSQPLGSTPPQGKSGCISHTVPSP